MPFMRTQVGQSTDSVKTSRLSQFLQDVFRLDTDMATLKLAAGTMGRLVKAGGPLTADVVDNEVCQILLPAQKPTVVPRSLAWFQLFAKEADIMAECTFVVGWELHTLCRTPKLILGFGF